ncbi:MAG: hypothetical protein Q9208_005910 [Pyrenodesmia sp. 3 TL-2023]
MQDLFRDTVFGRLLHLTTAGKLFGHDDQAAILALGKKHHSCSVQSSTSILTLALDDRPPGKNGNKANASANTPAAHQQCPTLADPEKGRDIMLIELSPYDSHNPRNWSTVKKLFVNFQICLLTTSIYIGSAIYTAGLEDIQHDFHVSPVESLLGLTLFVLGYALGPMILAPISETPYIGHSPVYVGTLLAFALLQLPIIYAPNFGTLLAFRFITGLIGSPVLATGGATIAEMYAPRKQVYGMGVWDIATVFGPALGPLIGGFAAQNKGWKWTIWELVWLSGFCFIFLFFFLPETSSKNILYRRTLRIRALTKNRKVKCTPELEAEGMSWKEVGVAVLVRPFSLSFTEPICFVLNLYSALIYGLLYLWFESFPIVFVDIYQFSGGTEGLAFLGMLIGSFIIMVPFFYYNHRFVEPQFNENDQLRPEIRLQPAMVGAFFIPVCLFWFGWSARPSVHWIMPIIGSTFFSMGSFLLFMAVFSYLGDAYPKYVASVFAGNDLIRSVVGAAFPLFANSMYRKLGVDWASSMLGFLSIAFIPIPFVLYFYGKRIRMASKMATHDL